MEPRSKDEPRMVVLVVEDDPDMRELLSQALAEEGFEIQTAHDGAQAMAKLERAEFDLLLTDLKMPGASGLDLLEAARARNLHQPVILMTAFGSIESAVTAMKRGAYSYITKPFDLDDLLCLIHEVAAQIRPRKQVESQTRREGDPDGSPIVYQSATFKGLMQRVQSVAESQASVLILGETGTGKELIAREIHRRGGRRDKPFVAVDVNAIAPTLLESELFGHVKGAFTGATKDHAGLFEKAAGGTLFLDEVGEIPASLQAKLLRFLQERRLRRVGDTELREVDLRLVSATNRDLRGMIKTGEFREDLFYRLAVVTLELPPLRERRADIPVLAYHFLRKINQNYQVTGFRPEVMDLLIDAPWPGNVRQLEGVVEHAAIFRKSGLIQKRDLPSWFLGEIEPQGTQDKRTLETVEREHILNLLEECNGNRSRTARILGINRRTLTRKLVTYGLSAEEDDRLD